MNYYDNSAEYHNPDDDYNGGCWDIDVNDEGMPYYFADHCDFDDGGSDDDDNLYSFYDRMYNI